MSEHSTALPQLPSQVVEPQRVATPPQQASTQPADGHHAHTHPSGPAAPQQQPTEQQRPSEQQPGHTKFAEQVIGYAQKTRGAVLRKSSLKEHGEQILEGRADAREPAPRA